MIGIKVKTDDKYAYITMNYRQQNEATTSQGSIT